MKRTNIIITIIFFFTICLHGQGVSDTIKAEHISANRIAGAYGSERVYYRFKANKKCKLKYIAPRPLVYKGSYELRNDTIICTFNRMNMIGRGKYNMHQSIPIITKFIINTDKLYKIKEENGQISLTQISKSK